ncbi:peroxiredoxin [Polymorphobacter multimanifer]|nr:peroxiredoxin [Polymorphobacter multimanifer]
MPSVAVRLNYNVHSKSGIRMTMDRNASKEGQPVPSATFKTRVRDDSVGGDNPFRWQDLTTEELFAGKRVVVFSLPGAFTPTCSNEQCPAYERYFDDFAAAGVDEVVCIAVNDAFVMHQWKQKLGVQRIRFVPDGSGHFTRAMGMMVNKDHLGFGERSWRYSMVVDDGVIRAFFEEPGRNDEGTDEDPYEVSDPETVLRWLTTHPRG